MKLLFCGNCQMGALQLAYRILVGPHTGDDVTAILFTQADRPPAQQAAAEADVIIEQMLPSYQDGWFKDVNPAARRIRVPNVSGTFLWPFAGVGHPNSVPRFGAYNPFGGELGDSWMVRQMKAGHGAARIEAEYLGMDIAQEARLDRRMEMTLDVQRNLERGTGYDFSAIIEGYFRTERLFRTPFHAEGRIMRHMLCVLLEQIEAPAAAYQAVANYLNVGLYQPKDMPMHPGVAAHFGLTWAQPDMQFRFLSETMLGFGQWVRRFVHCEAYPAVSKAVDAAMRNEAGAGALLDQAAAILPGSPLVAYARAVVDVRARRHAQALPGLRALAARFAELPQIHGFLAECHIALGHDAQAEAALREELARNAHVRGLYVRMASFLRERGRAAEAEPYRKIAEALAPSTPPR